MKKLLAILLILAMTFVMFAACGSSAKDEPASETTEGKDKIVIGGVRSQSGVFAVFDQTAYGPMYRMWADELNKDGGIYVEEYGKKLPVELLIYDDKSDLSTMTRLYERLILEDKVDLLLPPVSTAFLYAAVPIAQKYGYLMIGAEGGSASLKEYIDTNPGFFTTLNFTDTQIPALVEVLQENDITSSYIVYIEDLHGTEYFTAAQEAFGEAGIEIKGSKSVPPDIQDMTPIINDAKATGAQAFLVFAYPDQGFLAVGQSQAMAYNPDVFLIGPGGNADYAVPALGGPEAVEGLMAWGGWNEKSSDKLHDFGAHLREYFADDATFSVDWWGHAPYYVALEVTQQAIEKTGTLDNAKLIEYIRDNHFDTILGDTYFVNNMLAAECYAGNVGQWQGGAYEVIDVGGNRTADPIVPKPAWPAQ
ncbi:MAG: amino acid ABC transporter substrate-binding protein [Oscillospiraceae bacterium]|jgi:branched-chain amino acid transport system substrate-binding protein|nr:amino acid ABC transporter substrate-binding protein [Oscillospiraceae bacterium]